METKLIDLISQQNADAFKTAFEEAVAARVVDALETKKVEVAQNLFGEEAEQVSEKAPPGAKYERMVKHLKKSYSKDGVLTGKEKAIAYATAWKAKKKAK